MKGRIQSYPWVSCGGCRDEEPITREPINHGKRSGCRETSAEAARRMGWKYTKEHGWMCPRCQRKRVSGTS